jgi:iron only hydrogenase large subunit-like protein
MRALYAIDRKESLRVSHANQEVAQLYREFLDQPLSERSHELLHTHYAKRDVLT